MLIVVFAHGGPDEKQPDGRADRFTVFTPDGALLDTHRPTGVHLGSVETELDLGTMIIRDGHVLGVVTDELDVQYVVRARIVPEDS